MLNIIVSLAIFATCFVLFVSEWVHRTIAAMAGATVMLIFGMSRGFYTQNMALQAIDFNTIGLLLGMMIIVAILKRSGFFRYLAIKGVKLARGEPWKLLVILGLITAFVSMVLDNVTTVLLMAPVTLLISDILAINPIPLLVGEVVLSNLGGVATMIGDPPNIMIGSASRFTFNSFILHLMPVALLAMVVSLIALRVIFGSYLVKKEERVNKVLQMNEREAIKNKRILRDCILALAIVLALFASEKIHHIKPAFIALLGAIITLVLVRPKPDEILSEVQWSVLFFFAGLFIIVGGVDKTGILKIVGESLRGISSHLLILSLVIIWMSTFLSAFVDNIPYTATMIPVVKHLGALGVNIDPLWWALAIGAGFGGNGTPIGSSAGVVVMGLADRTPHPITFKTWIKSAGMVCLLTTVLATMIFVLGFGWFS